MLVCRTSAAVPLDAAPRPSAQSAVRAEPRIIRNVRYGTDIRQRFDVYAPADARDAPVIFMVHGGGWAYGDKSARGVVDNKVARWVPRGFVVISTNYRMLPKAGPVEQAQDVARALAVAQQRAASWGADRTKFVLMGHSAGAHLVSLLGSSPSLAGDLPLAPSLGVVSIESGALDVVAIMRGRHDRLYDRAFGRDTAYWRAASPVHAMTGRVAPSLLVCSVRRPTSCARAERFAAKAIALGGRASVLREDLSHADADARLGVDSVYTAGVESFLRNLDPSLDRLLSPPPAATPPAPQR
jgi:acetyl esterase/lipase